MPTGTGSRPVEWRRVPGVWGPPRPDQQQGAEPAPGQNPDHQAGEQHAHPPPGLGLHSATTAGLPTPRRAPSCSTMMGLLPP
ncbi:hypothetical protein, partial [Mycobacterium avium]|uniref:hypothetical protein n=1 Tax=Mycobacterium avium TaxID=1764 RepID=UPI001E37E593